MAKANFIKQKRKVKFTCAGGNKQEPHQCSGDAFTSGGIGPYCYFCHRSRSSNEHN